jgi:hypothetical protein
VTAQGIVNDDTGSGGTAHDPTGSTPPVQPSGRRLSPPLIAALVLGVALVAAVAVAGIVLGPSGATTSTPRPKSSAANPTGPVLLVPVDAPQAGSPDCGALLRRVPASLADGGTPLARRPLAKPAPPATAAWGGRDGEPVVLRCGIERPPELTPTSELLDVDGVQWLRLSADGLTTWYAVDRPVVVALTLPAGLGTGPIQDVSDSIGATLPAKPVF